MKIEHFPPEFETALPVLEKITAAGFEAYFVGGCVRDFLLHHLIHDVDIATNATPHEIAQLFPKYFDLGIEHGTIAVLERGETYEITTFRTEQGYEDFRRPSQVTFVRSLKEDLKRRDFTMNALAVDTNGNLIDLFDGLKDLEEKIIRAVGEPEERFSEDALRMMRGVRFAGQLGFSIEEKTFAAMKKRHNLLEKIAVERIRVEFEKLLLGDFATSGLQAFLDSELYRCTPHLLGEDKALKTLLHALQKQTLENPVLAWTLLYDFTSKKVGIETFLRAWKLSKNLMNDVKKLTAFLPVRKTRMLNTWEVYQLGNSLSQQLEMLMIYYQEEVDLAGVTEVFEQLPIKNKSELDLSGDDLLKNFQYPAGLWVGAALALVEKNVVIHRWPNEKNSLLEKMAEEFPWNKYLK